MGHEVQSRTTYILRDKIFVKTNFNETKILHIPLILVNAVFVGLRIFHRYYVNNRRVNNVIRTFYKKVSRVISIGTNTEFVNDTLQKSKYKVFNFWKSQTYRYISRTCITIYTIYNLSTLRSFHLSRALFELNIYYITNPRCILNIYKYRISSL